MKYLTDVVVEISIIWYKHRMFDQNTVATVCDHTVEDLCEHIQRIVVARSMENSFTLNH